MMNTQAIIKNRVEKNIPGLTLTLSKFNKIKVKTHL